MSPREDVSLASIMRGIGELHGELQGVHITVETLEGTIQKLSQQFMDVNARIVLHDNCIVRHEKRISDIYHKIENAQTQETTQLVRDHTRWSTLKILGTILLGLLTATGIFLGIYNSFFRKF